jgi:diaminopropionate ammonia-lyase
MRQLARPEGGDPPLEVGASGAAGLAVLLALEGAADADRASLGLTDAARACVIATEGVTEPDLWRDAVG